MTEEAFGGYAEVGCSYFAYRHEGNTRNDSRNCRYDAYVRSLAQTARGFVLPVGVSVRSNLQQEKEGQKRERKRQRPRQLPLGFLR
jgi:hypothetical protein